MLDIRSDAELTEDSWDNEGVGRVYLLDGNVVDIFEMLLRGTGVDMFKELEDITDVTYVFSTEVMRELMNREQGFSPPHLIDHLISTSGGVSEKEDRFLVEENGRVVVRRGNIVSATDWSQVLRCQNHWRLVLVTNDVKLGKNAMRVVGEVRMRTPISLLEELVRENPENERLRKALQFLRRGSILKLKRGDILTWLDCKSD